MNIFDGVGPNMLEIVEKQEVDGEVIVHIKNDQNALKELVPIYGRRLKFDKLLKISDMNFYI